MTSKLLYVDIINQDDICIHSLSYSNCGQYLALTYGNRISIYETNSNFLLATLTDDYEDASFRSIIWIPFQKIPEPTLSDYRLFTLGLHGVISEWNLKYLKLKISCDSLGGAIFSGVLGFNSDLLVACDDGKVRSFSVWDNYESLDRLPELNFRKVNVTHTGKVLSICSTPDERFYCGTSDSLILACSYERDNYFQVMRVSPNKSNKRVKRNIKEDSDLNEGVKVELEHEDENTQVWCLEFISSTNTLVSGDSNGNVIMWDLSTLTMLQMFTQHSNDVLSLGLFGDDILFSAGLDSKVTLYTKYTNKSNKFIDPKSLFENSSDFKVDDTINDKWVVNGFKYPIKGDIRSLSVNPVHELVVTGGNSGCVCVSKGSKFLSYTKSKFKFLYPNLNHFYSPISMNSNKNLALIKYLYHCDLWFIPTSNLGSVIRNGSIHSNSTNESSVSSLNDTFNEDLDESFNKLNRDVPYKLCTIKMNRDKGPIKNSCISPNGQIVCISNKYGLRILILDLETLKISQLKFEYPEIEVLSMSFTSNYELVICHLKHDKFIVSIYDINSGVMRDLNYIKFYNYVTKIVTYNKFISESESDSDERGKKKMTWGVFYCLDGDVYIVDFDKEIQIKIPNFDGGSRVSNVVFNRDSDYLVAFSTSFRYYVFDLVNRCILNYENKLIHTLPPKVVNSNSVILNSFWIDNLIVIHSTYNIFYIRLNLKHSNPLEGNYSDTQDNTPLSSLNNKVKTKTITPSRMDSTPDRRNRYYTNLIGPRRLYSIPSIEHQLYTPPNSQDINKELSMEITNQNQESPTNESIDTKNEDHQNYQQPNNDIKHTKHIKKKQGSDKYTIIAKNKFIVHSDIRLNGKYVKIIAFKASPQEGTLRKKKFGN